MSLSKAFLICHYHVEPLNNLESDSDAGKMCISSNWFLCGLSKNDIGTTSSPIYTSIAVFIFNLSSILLCKSVAFYFSVHIID